ncbi:MAG: Crp/Fnr family transcriptional regulator [Clostridia bacterium]|nr:Crp/Fnr family transcriptional regulator [Clostridia bacterium]
MKKYFEILRKCPLFNDIKDENLISMLDCLDVKVIPFRKKETIAAEGSPAKYIGIVLSGTAQLERTDYYGNRSIVTSIEASELFGESFACAGAEKIPFDIIAAENAEIMLIDCEKIINPCTNACSFHSQMIFNLLKIVATKNIILNQKAEITAKRTTREKLMTYLLSQAKKSDSNCFTIPYDRQELADYLQVDRSGLSSEISKLREEGIIESKKSRFKLL